MVFLYFLSHYSAPLHKIERIDCFLYALTLCDYFVVIVVIIFSYMEIYFCRLSYTHLKQVKNNLLS